MPDLEGHAALHMRVRGIYTEKTDESDGPILGIFGEHIWLKEKEGLSGWCRGSHRRGFCRQLEGHGVRTPVWQWWMDGQEWA